VRDQSERYNCVIELCAVRESESDKEILDHSGAASGLKSRSMKPENLEEAIEYMVFILCSSIVCTVDIECSSRVRGAVNAANSVQKRGRLPIAIILFLRKRSWLAM